MKYDSGLKIISKATGMTGVEAKHIVNALNKQNIGFDVVDWKTLGEEARGFGDRTKGVKRKLREMYGISTGIVESDMGNVERAFNESQEEFTTSPLREINDRRSKRARIIDLNLQTKHTFHSYNEEGVKKWKKHPNRFDIFGVDDKW